MFPRRNLKYYLLKVLNPPTTSNNNLNPALNYYGKKVRVKFTRSCLKQVEPYYRHKK